MPEPHPNIVLLGADNLCVRVVQRFPPVGQIPSHSRNGKQHGEKLRREAHGTIYQSRKEVDVGVEATLDKVGVSAGNGLKLESHLDEGVPAGDGKYLFGNLPDDLGAGVLPKAILGGFRGVLDEEIRGVRRGNQIREDNNTQNATSKKKGETTAKTVDFFKNIIKPT
jgi:hypothetical protein